MMTDLTKRAMYFARAIHKKQTRKYTGEPYFVHCAEVAELVYMAGGTEEQIAAAYLHDVVEDTDVSLDDIQGIFGAAVCELVEELTDISKPSDGNRAFRKAMDMQHLAGVSAAAKTVKLADMISNTRSIVAHDKDFARVYLSEMSMLLPFLLEGEPTLFRTAERLLVEAQEELVQFNLSARDFKERELP